MWTKGGLEGLEKGLPRRWAEPEQVSTGSYVANLWKTSFLPETFQEVVYLRVEIRILLSKVLDLSDGVDYGRVMLTSEAAPYFRQRCMRQGLTEVHRDLAGHRDRFRIISGLQVRHL